MLLRLELLLKLLIVGRPEAQRPDFETIRTIKQQGLTILLIEQNASMALSVADRGYVMEHGEIRFHDTAHHLRTQDSVKKAYLGH